MAKKPQELDLNFDQLRADLILKFMTAARPFLNELAKLDELEGLLRRHTELIAGKASVTAKVATNGSHPPIETGATLHEKAERYRPKHKRRRGIRTDKKAVAPLILQEVTRTPGISSPELIQRLRRFHGLIDPSISDQSARAMAVATIKQFLRGQIRFEKKGGKGEAYHLFPIRRGTASTAPPKPPVKRKEPPKSRVLRRDYYAALRERMITELVQHSEPLTAVELRDIAQDAGFKTGPGDVLSNVVSRFLRQLVAQGKVKRQDRPHAPPLFTVIRPQLKVSETTEASE